jgi:hypothetical protein
LLAERLAASMAASMAALMAALIARRRPQALREATPPKTT